ncbi:MAG: PQQ-like beta-propeller repeat protein [Mariniphaga sp.]|nr:PQQ-like beta-propeller repeat protein [Mariniphaga sp.]
MKNLNLIPLLLIGCLMTISVNNLNGQNSSGWMGDDRNGTVEGFNIPDTWPSELNKAWQIKVGESDASPVLLNNKIYLHVKLDDSETALCLDAANGTELWRTILNPAPEVSGPASGHPGPRSTPFITDGKIYTLGAGGIFTCLDAETGKVIWKNDAYTKVPRFFTSCSPLVFDGICVIQLGDSDSGIVVAFDANSGKEIWKLEGAPCTYSSPVLMKTFDGLILVQSETNLLGVSPKGEVLWKIATPIQRMNYNAPTPAYNGNTIIVAGQGSGTKAFSLTKTGTSWETTELWSNNELGTSFNTPMIKDGFIYANEARLGKLFCLNAKTGETTWLDETTLNRFASILDLGKVLVSLPANGTLIIFEPNGNAFTELAKYKVSETDIYAHPLFSENNIFIKDKEMLTCWSVK